MRFPRRIVPIWVSDLRRDALEPRLFPRAGARYDHRIGITQVLVSPFCDRRFGPDRSARVDGAYLHLKFCKRDPYANYSDDLARLIEDNLTVGPPLDDEAVRLLVRWGLDVPVARRA